MEDFDLIGPDDRPALVAINTPDAQSAVKSALRGMGFKVHEVETHPQFESRYNQVNYQVIVIEENFGGGSLLDNSSLQMVQALPMNRRRHGVFFLLGSTMKSLDTLQAFAQSVHCVLNFSDVAKLSGVVKKTLAENDMFLSAFREAERRLRQKGA